MWYTVLPLLVKVTYPSGVSVELGSKLTPRQVKDQPSVSWPTEEGAYYVLIKTGQRGAWWWPCLCVVSKEDGLAFTPFAGHLSFFSSQVDSLLYTSRSLVQ